MSWAIVAVAVSAIGTAVGTYSAVASADAQEDAAFANAKNDKMQANIAAEQAQIEADQVRRNNRIRLGMARANAAKNGVDISGGSAEDVFNDLAVQGELEALSTSYAGQTQSAYLRNRARMSRWEGRQAKSAGYLNAASTLLSGASKTYNTYKTASGPKTTQTKP